MITFRLKQLLIEKNRGVRELSRMTGLTVPTISRIANNRNKGISLDVIGKICQALDVTPGDLLQIVDDSEDK